MDYWDYLGWADPFADAAYTARQERYALTLGLASMYTPQTLVNFTEINQFSQAEADDYIAYFLEHDNPTVSVTVWLESASDASPLIVNYLVDGAPEGAELSMVATETDLVSDVTSGENNGDTLPHQSVARGLTTVTGDLASGQLEITTQDGFEPTAGSITAFVQDSTTLEFLGATKIHLTQ